MWPSCDLVAFWTHSKSLTHMLKASQKGAMAGYNFWRVVFGVGFKKRVDALEMPKFCSCFFLVKC